MTNFNTDKSFFLFFATIIVLSIGNGADGKPPSAISGGTLALPGEFKYIVQLRIGKDHLCGGAIISEKHILTAAHCVETGLDPTVVSGIIDIGDPNGQAHRVSEIIIHPHYVPYTLTSYMECDIAILVLEDKLELGDNLEKVNLPGSQVGPKQSGIIAGWGYISSKYKQSPLLHKMTVNFLNKRDCLAMGISITRGELCGYHAHGNICGGDSGSPLVYKNAVVGIASASACMTGHPHIYVNVYRHRDWIREVMSQE